MKKILSFFVLFIFLIVCNCSACADDGYRLWLKYDLISNPPKLKEYRESIKAWMIEGNSPTIDAAKHELRIGLDGLLGTTIPEVSSLNESGVLIAGTYEDSSVLTGIDLRSKLEEV